MVTTVIPSEDRTKRLAALHNRATRYEVVVTNGNVIHLLGYMPKTRTRLIKTIHNHGEKLVALTGADLFTMPGHWLEGCKIGDWTVKFSGRTERECVIEGERSRLS